jgi:hypothetical protein
MQKAAAYSENKMTERYIEIYERFAKDHATEGIAI